MVLEDITNSTRSNSRTRRRTSTTQSTVLDLHPTQHSSLGLDSETEESRACSAATLLRGRRTRLSHELIRRLSTELQKRRRESLSVIDSSASAREKCQRRSSSLQKRRSLFEVLDDAENDAKRFPKGYSMELASSLSDQRLSTLHDQFRDSDQSIGSLDHLVQEYGSDLKAALVKFLDTAVGYLLYIQLPSHPGVTSKKPLDSLLVLWVNPSHQDRGVERSLLHWWVKSSVRTVKYFTVRSASSFLTQLLRKEGFKLPETSDVEQKTYIAST